MTHPEELLADYVDGTLSAQERTAVETHVAGCPRCSRETTLASSARSALRSLEEVPAPEDIGSQAIGEAEGAGSAAAGGGTPRWYRVGGVVGAVAAGLLVFTLVLPHIGQNSSDDGGATTTEAGREAEAAKALAAEATGIEIRHENYDNDSLTALTTSYAAEDTSAGGADLGAASSGPAPSPATGSQAQTDKALECILQSAPKDPGDLRRLIRARFEGMPAYLAVFTDGPGANQPADTVTVWVFATDDCSILSFSSGRL
jgi:putative zinc finger protein